MGAWARGLQVSRANYYTINTLTRLRSETNTAVPLRPPPLTASVSPSVRPSVRHTEPASFLSPFPLSFWAS